METKKHVLICGAGCFGLSTAYHLLLGGYKVTVLDASVTVPAPDAASSDLNKVVRSSYSDPFYTLLCRDAIKEFKRGEICGKDTYHESGVLVLGVQKTEGGESVEALYADTGFQNDIAAGARVRELRTPGEIATALPKDVVLGPLFQTRGAYWNEDGGWVAASKAMNALLENVKRLGGQVTPNSKVTGLLFGEKPGDKVVGAMLEEGTAVYADVVVLAMGAWTPSVIGNIEPLKGFVRSSLLATGQTIATIKLSSEMAARYQIPVMVDFTSGFYMFPPNEEGFIKFAIHDEGYTHTPTAASKIASGNAILTPNIAGPNGSVSTPRTIRTHGDTGTFAPAAALEALHASLQNAYPELAALPLKSTRMCWYMDTPDENWMIDEIAGYPSLFVATGGSGHAFKFLPVIGKLIKDRIEGTMEASVATKFSVTRKFALLHESRHGHARDLKEEDLLSAQGYNDTHIGRPM